MRLVLLNFRHRRPEIRRYLMLESDDVTDQVT